VQEAVADRVGQGRIVLEDGIDVAVGAGLDRAGAGARGLEPLGAVALGQAQDAEAGAIERTDLRFVAALGRLNAGASLCVLLAAFVLSMTESLTAARLYAGLRLNLTIALLVVYGIRLAAAAPGRRRDRRAVLRPSTYRSVATLPEDGLKQLASFDAIFLGAVGEAGRSAACVSMPTLTAADDAPPSP
jgi:hypothetical protein